MAAPISFCLGELASGSLPRPVFVTNFLSEMTGFCPNGTGPPACVMGPKWSPNDPLFYMHHAVRVTSAARFNGSPSPHHMAA